jgi:hypothetical protein
MNFGLYHLQMYDPGSDTSTTRIFEDHITIIEDDSKKYVYQVSRKDRDAFRRWVQNNWRRSIDIRLVGQNGHYQIDTNFVSSGNEETFDEELEAWQLAEFKV